MSGCMLWIKDLIETQPTLFLANKSGWKLNPEDTGKRLHAERKELRLEPAAITALRLVILNPGEK